MFTEIIKGLERREYDLLVMGRPPAHVAVEREVLGDHPHVLVAAPDMLSAIALEVRQLSGALEAMLGGT